MQVIKFVSLNERDIDLCGTFYPAFEHLAQYSTASSRGKPSFTSKKPN